MMRSVLQAVPGLKGCRLALLLFALVALCQLGSLAFGYGYQPGAWSAAPMRRKIVFFNPRFANSTGQQALVNSLGASHVKSLPMVNAEVVWANPTHESALRYRPEVLRVEDDVYVTALRWPYRQRNPYQRNQQNQQAQGETIPWGVAQIGSPLVWDKNNDKAVDAGADAGQGVKIGIIDTGIDPNNANLAANIAGGANILAPGQFPYDDNGHGTHVAGIVAAADNGSGIAGVAPQASLYAVKVLDSSGGGYTSDIIEGIQWCASNGIKVINMSMGTTQDVQSLHDAITAAYKQGIVFVAAAGNDGPGANGADTVEFPGKYPEVIAVAATDSSNNVASWSSAGPEVAVAAPGVNILSTYGGGYAILSGTSMAAPHVTGAVALLVEAGITDPAAIRSKLEQSATHLGAAGVNTLSGYGLVDVARALGD